MEEVKIKFLVTYTVKDVEAKTYEAGKSYKVGQDTADHFIGREMAELYVPKTRSKTGGK